MLVHCYTLPKYFSNSFRQDCTSFFAGENSLHLEKNLENKQTVNGDSWKWGRIVLYVRVFHAFVDIKSRIPVGYGTSGDPVFFIFLQIYSIETRTLQIEKNSACVTHTEIAYSIALNHSSGPVSARVLHSSGPSRSSTFGL